MSLPTSSPRPKRWLPWLIGIGFVAACGLGYWASERATSPPDVPSGTGRDAEPAATAHPWFQDVTAGSGLDFTCHNGEEANLFTILESLGGGVALLDYDGDGLLDVFVTGGGRFEGNELRGLPCKLYRNLGNFQFEDVTARVGLDRVAWWYTHGAAVADYDRDGWPDLLVTGFGRLALFHNEPDPAGGRRFVDVTERLGLADASWSTSAGWADVDGDGFPDLYVCHYCDWSLDNHPRCAGQRVDVPVDVCPPVRFKPLPHTLFRNEGGARFRNASARLGSPATGYGLGVVLADVNGDGRPDIFVANDASPKFLFMNRGGTFEEKALAAGVAAGDTGRYDGSMGVDVGDFDGSGRPALWVANYQGQLHGLYRRLGNENFQHWSKSVGLGAIGQHLVGFGTGFIDADNDGWEDLIIAHGHVVRFPGQGSTVHQRPMLLRNEEGNGNRRFRDLGAEAGPYFNSPRVGRGLAIGDLDNDGWPDVIVSHANSPVVVLRNVGAGRGGAHWVGVRLVGRDHRDVVGSVVALTCGGRTLTRFAKGGGSYLSANDARLLFGLGGETTVGSVTVKWSWGETQTFNGLEADAYWELREGEPAAKRMR